MDTFCHLILYYGDLAYLTLVYLSVTFLHEMQHKKEKNLRAIKYNNATCYLYSCGTFFPSRSEKPTFNQTNIHAKFLVCGCSK